MPATQPESAAAILADSTWPGAIEGLRARIVEAFRSWRQQPDSRESLSVRLKHPAPFAKARDWLVAQNDATQVYWRGRSDAHARAGVGCADRVRGGHAGDYEAIFERCRRYLPAGAVYFGGFAFDEGSDDDPAWADFGPAHFWLPQFEYLEGESGGLLACNLIFRKDRPLDCDELCAELQSLRPPSTGEPFVPPILDRRDSPDPAVWEGMVMAALALIGSGALEKIVLARRALHRFAAPVHPASMISRLAGVTSNCFHFSLQPSAGSAFVGTTPERLFRREGPHLLTEVIAGTRTRDVDPSRDAALREDLMNSAKDQLEHDIVRKFLRQRLHLLSDEVSVQGSATVLILERKQHLYSAAQARLCPGINDADVIAALHPTPAVGGSPSDNARAEIRRLEPFRRGWYAAPVGWIGGDSAEFAVAIRSGLVRGDTVSVYSGAGIVEGSDPAREWEEIEHKISDFRKVAGPVPPRQPEGFRPA
jgi:menaquinone-specific isochorismate synthase